MIWLLVSTAMAADLSDLTAALPAAEVAVETCRSGGHCDAQALYTVVLADWVYGDPVDPREIGTLAPADAALYGKLPKEVRSQRGQAFRLQGHARDTERPDPMKAVPATPVIRESERPDPVEEDLVQEAIALQLRGELAEARALFEGVERGRCGFYEARFRLGLIYRQIDQIEDAIAAFRIAAGGESHRATTAMLQLGEIYEALEEHVTARAWYDLAGLSDSRDGQRAVLRAAWLAHLSGDDREAGKLVQSMKAADSVADFPLLKHRLRILSELPPP